MFYFGNFENEIFDQVWCKVRMCSDLYSFLCCGERLSQYATKQKYGCWTCQVINCLLFADDIVLHEKSDTDLLALIDINEV
jgi:hypothetical protein